MHKLGFIEPELLLGEPVDREVILKPGYLGFEDGDASGGWIAHGCTEVFP